MSDAPSKPQFCPWCGATVAYEDHHHEARIQTLAEPAPARGETPPPLPENVEELMRPETFVAACSGCRVLSHVIGHHARP